MKTKTLIAAFTAFLIISFLFDGNAQRRPSGDLHQRGKYLPNTGDPEINLHLQKINDYGLNEVKTFRKELGSKFNLSSRELVKNFSNERLVIFWPDQEIDIRQTQRPSRRSGGNFRPQSPGPILDPGDIFILKPDNTQAQIGGADGLPLKRPVSVGASTRRNFQPGSDLSLEGKFFFFKVNRMEEDKHGKFLNGTGQDIILFWPGDAYYALALSKQTGRPLAGLLENIAKNKNWEEVNKNIQSVHPDYDEWWGKEVTEAFNLKGGIISNQNVHSRSIRKPDEGFGLVKYFPNTGNAKIDKDLQDINKYGLADIGSFKNNLSSKFNLSQEQIGIIVVDGTVGIIIDDGAVTKPGWDPALVARSGYPDQVEYKVISGQNFLQAGDAFYALSLSRFSDKPLSGLLQQFSKKQNWNEINRELGITPGSEKFKLFKEWVDEISVYPQ